jgi:hypothetical protein
MLVDRRSSAGAAAAPGQGVLLRVVFVAFLTVHGRPTARAILPTSPSASRAYRRYANK